MSRGYCAIGIEHTKIATNVGTLWRSAHCLGADFMFTVGKRYKSQPSDTTKAWKTLPLWHFDSINELVSHSPLDCPIIGVELSDQAHQLESYVHPDRAIYLLGAEDSGLSDAALSHCSNLVQFQSKFCLNVASAGIVVLYDRQVKEIRKESVNV